MKRLTNAKHAGRPMDFRAFDGKTHNGRVIEIKLRNWLVFTYYVPGFGEVRNTLDLRKESSRVEVF